MMAMIARRFETEHVADAIEIGPARFLVDANGAVALDVRMAADRGDARAGLAVVALEEQQIGDLLDELGPPLLLGNPHAVTDDRRVRADVDFGAAADLRLLDPLGGYDVGPMRRLDIDRQRIETTHWFRDQIMVED